MSTILALTSTGELDFCHSGKISTCHHIAHQTDRETPQEFCKRVNYSSENGSPLARKGIMLRENPMMKMEDFNEAEDYLCRNEHLNETYIYRCPHCNVGFNKLLNAISHVATCKKAKYLNELINSGASLLEICKEIGEINEKNICNIDNESMFILRMNKGEFFRYIDTLNLGKKGKRKFFKFANSGNFKGVEGNLYIYRLKFLFGIETKPMCVPHYGNILEGVYEFINYINSLKD